MEQLNWDKKRGKGQGEGLGKGVKIGKSDATSWGFAAPQQVLG